MTGLVGAVVGVVVGAVVGGVTAGVWKVKRPVAIPNPPSEKMPMSTAPGACGGVTATSRVSGRRARPL